MENKTMVSNNVEFSCDLADQMLEMDGWGAEWNHNEDGDESYSEGTQDRFNKYYSAFWVQINDAKD